MPVPSPNFCDDEYEGVKEISQSLYDFCSCEPGEKENVVLIFFHGISLDQLNSGVSTRDTPFKTWTFQNDDSKYWPSVMFKEDEYLKDRNIVVRALNVVYDSSKFKTSNSGRLDVYQLAENFRHLMLSKLAEKDVRKPIIFVAHSFGGFVVQEFIDHIFCHARRERNSWNMEQEVLSNLGGVFFYGTPFRALEEETFDHFFPDPIPRANGTAYSSFVDLLKTYNASLARKQSVFKENLSTIASSYRGGKSIKVSAVFEINKTTVGDWTGLIAHEGTARLHGLGRCHFIEADHFDICKMPAPPQGFLDNKYISLRNLIEVVKADFS